MARPAITPNTPDTALDGVHLIYRRGSIPSEPGIIVNLVETTLPIPALGISETITRKVSDIPLSVFTGVSDTNAKQLHMKQVRAVLEWPRREASLDP